MLRYIRYEGDTNLANRDLNQCTENYLTCIENSGEEFNLEEYPEHIAPRERESSNEDDDPDCPMPDRMGGAIMASTKLRLLKIRNSHTDFEEKDLKITISPTSIALNTIGGVTAPSVTYSSQPLVIRVRSETLQNLGIGHERCIEMERTTGLLISGTWQSDKNECEESK